jgi:signal transduction histidine kinase
MDWATGRRGVVLTVADTGTGMSPQTLAKVREPFFTTKGDKGTGLGLWISQEIVDRHRGVLRVRSSQAVGGSGTVFTLFLPC